MSARPGQERLGVRGRALAKGLGANGHGYRPGDLCSDERFASPATRRAHADALISELGATFAGRDATEWEEELMPEGIAMVKAHDSSYSEFACTDPVLRQTDMVIEIDHPVFGPILRAGPALRFSETPSGIATSCLNGQHTQAILSELASTMTPYG